LFKIGLLVLWLVVEVPKLNKDIVNLQLTLVLHLVSEILSLHNLVTYSLVKIFQALKLLKRQLKKLKNYQC